MNLIFFSRSNYTIASTALKAHLKKFLSQHLSVLTTEKAEPMIQRGFSASTAQCSLLRRPIQRGFSALPMPPTLPLSRQDCCRLFLKTLCCTSILFSNISDHWNLISTLWTNIMWHRLEWLAHPLQAGALLHHQLSAAAEGVSGLIAVRGKTRIHYFLLSLIL